jgi:hypothetical protein
VETAKRLAVISLVGLGLATGCGQVTGRSAANRLSNARQATAPAGGTRTVDAVSPAPSPPGHAATALDVPASSSWAAQVALDRIVRQYGPYVASSGVVNTASHPIAVVAYSPSPASPAFIEVLNFAGGQWLRGAGFTSPISVADSGSGVTPIVMAHLTGTAVPDFIVYMLGADFRGAAVVSAATGKWRMVPFSRPGFGEDVIAPDVKVHGGYLSSVTNNCQPNCAASSSYTTTNYRYDSENDAFRPLTTV